MDEFEARNAEMIDGMGRDPVLAERTRAWFESASQHEYSYHFTWLGEPVIQFPQDLVALQEIIWRTQPDLIVETGIARGGSLVFYASMLELLGGDRRVVGIDIDLRAPNRARLESHRFFPRMTLLDGSSVADDVISRVHDLADGRERVMVVLDSLHTHDHVLAELHAYASLVHEGGYVVVLDTVIEEMPASFSADRPWGPGDNPRTAVDAFLAETDRFVVDSVIESKLQITVGRGGYLRCTRTTG